MVYTWEALALKVLTWEALALKGVTLGGYLPTMVYTSLLCLPVYHPVYTPPCSPASLYRSVRCTVRYERG